MNHQKNLKKCCRLCISNLNEHHKRPYNVKNVWIQEFITGNFEEPPNLSLENDTIFPKQICNECYHKMYNYQAMQEKHRKNQAKKSKDKRTKFVYSGTTVNIPTEDDFHHSIDCKVCGEPEEVEAQIEQTHVEASPGTYKRKNTSPSLTPKSKRVDIRKPGTARRTLELDKLERMDVEIDDEEVEFIKKSTIGTKVASDREIVKEENVKDKSVAKLFTCYICTKLSRNIVKLDTCNHVFCRTCITEWNSVSGKCIECNKAFNKDNIVRLHKDMKLVHESLEVRCRKQGCLKELNLHELTEHEENCHARCASTKTKLGHLLGDHKHKHRAVERIEAVKEDVKNVCQKTGEDDIDVIFALLTTTLEEKDIKLQQPVKDLHELYSNGILEKTEVKQKEVTIEETTALKNYTNMTSQNVVKTNRFHNVNKTLSSMVAYPKIVECEKELDVGNVDYKLINKEDNTVTKEHKKTIEDPTIDLDSDIGALTSDLINVPAEGVRINIQDGIAKGLEMIYPDLLHEVSQKLPKLCLTDHILVAHVKTCLDGTLDEGTHRKSTDRTEVDHWLPGTYSILQLDVLFQDGTRAMIWKEKDPNSILSNPPFALYKADEGNKASISYLLKAHEKETQELKTNFVDIEIEVNKSDIKQSNEFERDLNMEAKMKYEGKTHDDVVKQEKLENYKGKPEVKENQSEKEKVTQRFEIRVTRTVDEKLSRILHGRATAGSSRPCVCCSLSREDCKNKANWGTQPITQTSELEKQIANFCLDNPMKLSSQAVSKVAEGMKSRPVTNVEPKDEVPDNLHFKINVSEYLFTIQKRIVAVEDDVNPTPKYDNVAANKDKNHQTEIKLLKALQNKLTILPKTMEQNPGKFAREYLDSNNRDIILAPMKDSEEKNKFANLLKAMDPVKEIIDKSEPTHEDRANMSNYSKAVQSAMAELTWVHSWPNQFIRLTHHAGSFLNDPHGIGAIQPYGSEALEAANSWIKRYDKYFTFRGDRKKAIRTVFKKRYLKSCYKLRKYIPVAAHGRKTCSKCGTEGHQRNSRVCTARGAIELEGEEEEEEEEDQEEDQEEEEDQDEDEDQAGMED